MLFDQDNKLNQVVNLIAAAILHGDFFMEQITTAPNTWYVFIDLAFIIFYFFTSTPIIRKPQKLFAFKWTAAHI